MKAVFRGKRKTMRFPIYKGKFTIIMNQKLDTIAEEFNVVFDPANFVAGVFVVDGIVYAAFELDEVTPGVIAHEAFHVVCQLFGDIGAKIDIANDEPPAYLLTWVVDEIHKVYELALEARKKVKKS